MRKQFILVEKLYILVESFDILVRKLYIFMEKLNILMELDLFSNSVGKNWAKTQKIAAKHIADAAAPNERRIGRIGKA